MKNYFTGVLLFALFPLCSQAQVVMPEKKVAKPDTPVLHGKFKTPSTRVNIVSDWYNYGQMIYNLGGDVSYFRNFMFPDSTVQVEFTDGMGNVWKHSIGEVLDPSSTYFDATGQVSVENTVPYTLDSVAIPYRYWRYQNAVADPLVVQVYMAPNIQIVPNPGWTSGASYANVEYDYLTRIGKNETLTIKYPLTIADTATGTQGVLQFPVNLGIAAGDKVAVTATYIPGNTYNVNDTIDTYTSFPVTNKINAFVLYDFRDNDLGYESLYYNNELTATTNIRYNFDTNGWDGEYIPGTAWLSGIYYADMYFKLTFDTDAVGVAETAAETGVQVYPNPGHDVLNINSVNPVVEVNVTDMGGKKVISEIGNNITRLNAAALSNGIYVVHLQNDKGQVLRQRWVKQ